ncbi:MAG TPA: hypothetical protein VGW98_06870 [Solirubrobacteraceae bacterium]|jgi:hypothetical protein|nr:hypothetical protein [Solirubrobacteraceae bacterium]
MIKTRRIATAAVAAAITVGSMGAPALGASSHWSKSQCKSYATGFKSRNPHPSKARRAEGNKVLKKHGCTQHV